MTENKIIASKDKEGNEVKVMLKVPGAEEYRDSQLEYNRAFRAALDSGALLRQKLSDYMEEQGIWNEEKQKQNDAFVKKINDKEEVLKRGGIRLSEAKQIALDLRVLRAQFRDFLAEKNQMDQNSAEGQADNARFAELVRLCMLNPNTRQPYFMDKSDYDKASEQPWVIEAAGDLAGMIYGLDPNYDDKLEENKFLKEFDFTNEEHRLINDAGHLIDVDGRLISEEGRFVAYRTEEAEAEQDLEQRYYVNKLGDEVIEVTHDDGSVTWEKPDLAERKPFLDDEDKPVQFKKVEAKTEDESAEESEETEETEETEAKAKPKRRRKTTKSETDAEA